uniref:ABC-type transport auxiliary lipoprotein family protein n=1 Tax=Sphingomonas bacterium TaxID=1895847 RepID=UPI0015774FDC
MTTRYPTGAVAPLAAALLLTGCALLGGGKPVQLYRFGAPPTASPATGGVVPTPRYTVLLMPVRFAAGIDGDRVLASRGSETLYIKGLRWVAPAPVLFGEEAQASFRARAPWIALTDRRGGAPADHILQIRIDRFEARYDAGAKAPPTIHVEGEAMLGDVRTPGVSSRYRLVAEQQATAGD